MKSALTNLFLMIFFFVFQTSAIPAVFFGLSHGLGFSFLDGQTLNLVLQWLIYMALNRDLSGALIWAILAGIVGRWFGLGWNGALASGFFVVALVCTFLRRHVLLKDPLSVAIFFAVAFLIEGFVHLNFGRFLNQIPDPYDGTIGFLLLNALLNGLFAPVTYSVLRWLDVTTGGIEVRSRRALLYDL